MEPITKEEWEDLIAQWQEDNNTKKYPSAKQLAEIEADAITAGSGKTQDELDKAEKDSKIPKTKAGIDAWIATKTAPTELAGPLDVRPPRQIQSGSTRRSAPTVTYTGEFLVDEFGKPTADQLTDTQGDNQAVIFFQQLQESGEAQAFIQDLYKRQFYQGRKPSAFTLAGNGVGDVDMAAIKMYIDQANMAGLTPKAYMKDMLKLAAAPTEGASGPSITTVEAVRYLREESFKQLGRPLTGPEIAEAVGFVKSKVAGKVSPDVAAQERVLTANSQEASVYSLGLALRDMFA